MASFSFEGQSYKVPDRDSQRSKVYRAEDRHAVLFPDAWKCLPGANDDIAIVQQFVDMVTSLPVWQEIHDEIGRSAPKVTAHTYRGRGGRGWRGGIELGKGRPRSPCYILHELAHSMPGAHHWPFTRAYLALVRAVLGAKVGDALRDCFREGKVKYRKPRFVSTAERQRLQERGRQLAAAAKLAQTLDPQKLALPAPKPQGNTWVDFVEWQESGGRLSA